MNFQPFLQARSQTWGTMDCGWLRGPSKCVCEGKSTNHYYLSVTVKINQACLIFVIMFEIKKNEKPFAVMIWVIFFIIRFLSFGQFPCFYYQCAALMSKSSIPVTIEKGGFFTTTYDLLTDVSEGYFFKFQNESVNFWCLTKHSLCKISCFRQGEVFTGCL